VTPVDAPGWWAVAALMVLAAGVCWAAGTYMLVTWWVGRPGWSRRGLAERLGPLGPTPLADDAQAWLRRR